MNTLDLWTEEVCTSLGIEPGEVARDLVLDVARDVAHGVTRPAAPLTTFLLGVAVGKGIPVSEAAARVTGLVQQWPTSE